MLERITKLKQTQPHRHGYATLPLFQVFYDGENIAQLVAELGGWYFSEEHNALYSTLNYINLKLLEQVIPLLVEGDIEYAREIQRRAATKAVLRQQKQREAWFTSNNN